MWFFVLKSELNPAKINAIGTLPRNEYLYHFCQLCANKIQHPGGIILVSKQKN